jgi:hypothetical protein
MGNPGTEQDYRSDTLSKVRQTKELPVVQILGPAL